LRCKFRQLGNLWCSNRRRFSLWRRLFRYKLYLSGRVFYLRFRFGGWRWLLGDLWLGILSCGGFGRRRQTGEYLGLGVLSVLAEILLTL